MAVPSHIAIARRTLFGVSLSILALYILVTAMVAGFRPESLAFIGPLIVIPALTGLALRRWSGKTSAVAALVGLLLIIFNVPFTDLVNPTSTLEFIFVSVGTFGGLIVLITASLAFVGRNRESPATPKPLLQYGLTALVIVPLLAAIGGAAAWAGGGSDVSASERATATAIEIKKFDFTPSSVTADSPTLVVSNNDLVRHTFTVKDLDINVELNPGRETIIDISSKPAGTYDVTCSVPGHESMESSLVIS